MQVRVFSESIAFYGGEHTEKARLAEAMQRVGDRFRTYSLRKVPRGCVSG